MLHFLGLSSGQRLVSMGLSDLLRSVPRLQPGRIAEILRCFFFAGYRPNSRCHSGVNPIMRCRDPVSSLLRLTGLARAHGLLSASARTESGFLDSYWKSPCLKAQARRQAVWPGVSPAPPCSPDIAPVHAYDPFIRDVYEHGNPRIHDKRNPREPDFLVQLAMG